MESSPTFSKHKKEEGNKISSPPSSPYQPGWKVGGANSTVIDDLQSNLWLVRKEYGVMEQLAEEVRLGKRADLRYLLCEIHRWIEDSLPGERPPGPFPYDVRSEPTAPSTGCSRYIYHPDGFNSSLMGCSLSKNTQETYDFICKAMKEGLLNKEEREEIQHYMKSKNPTAPLQEACINKLARLSYRQIKRLYKSNLLKKDKEKVKALEALKREMF